MYRSFLMCIYTGIENHQGYIKKANFNYKFHAIKAVLI